MSCSVLVSFERFASSSFIANLLTAFMIAVSKTFQRILSLYYKPNNYGTTAVRTMDYVTKLNSQLDVIVSCQIILERARRLFRFLQFYELFSAYQLRGILEFGIL